MHDYKILHELFLILLSATIAVLLFNRIRVPIIVGLLICGIAIGPHGLHFVTLEKDIELLAEIGVALLLFTIGMEFSLTELKRMKKEVLIGGTLQVLVTGAIATGIALFFGFPLPQSIFLGQLIALSSTAVVLSLLAAQNEIDTPHGHSILGILLFQDLMVIPMMLITPLLSTGEIQIMVIGWSFIKAMLVIGGVLLLAVTIVPKLLEIVVRSRVRELLVLGPVVIATGIAWGTSTLGLSLALGAFIAGLAVSESPYSHQITAEILPFKDVFNSLFFISIGMLLDVHFLVEHFAMIAVLVVVIIVGKSLIGAGVTRLLTGSTRLAFRTGIGIGQIGEFSFILATIGVGVNLMNADQYQLFLACAILSMIISPFLIQFSPKFVQFIPESLTTKITKQQQHDIPELKTLQQHTIIVGFGLNGHYLARVLKESSIPYCILELNPHTVRKARAEGEMIFFGDAGKTEILNTVNVGNARLLVLTCPQFHINRKVLTIVRQRNPHLFIIVRTQFDAHVEQLYQHGASYVISEEFETATEIFARVLMEYDLPKSVIDSYIEVIRREGASLQKQHQFSFSSIDRLRNLLAGAMVENFVIMEDSPHVGKSLVDLDLRKETGATVIAIVRKNKPEINPPAQFILEIGDILVVLGSHKGLSMVKAIIYSEGSI